MLPRRERYILLTVAAVAFAVAIPSRLSTALTANIARNQDDFLTFYRTAQCLFVEACDPYLYIPGINPNLAPPHAHLVLAPVLWLPQFDAYLVWIAISIVALVVTGIRSAPLYRGLTGPGSAALAAAAAGSGLMMALISSGQIYAVLAWPVTEAWLALRQRRPARAAVLIALAASVKPMVLLAIPWLALRGEQRAAVIATVAFAATFVVGLLCFGAAPYAGWLNTVAHLPREGHFRDGSILETLIRGFTTTEYFPRLADAPSVVFPLWSSLSALIVAITLLMKTDLDRGWLSVLSASCLVAPKGWLYAGWWLAFPALAVCLSRTGATRWLLIIAGALLWLPDSAPMWGQPNVALTLTWGSLYLWTWFILWLASTFDLEASTHNPRPS